MIPEVFFLQIIEQIVAGLTFSESQLFWPLEKLTYQVSSIRSKEFIT